MIGMTSIYNNSSHSTVAIIQNIYYQGIFLLYFFVWTEKNHVVPWPGFHVLHNMKWECTSPAGNLALVEETIIYR
jgi:hypothetical protein